MQLTIGNLNVYSPHVVVSCMV